eukprot:191435_1
MTLLKIIINVVFLIAINARNVIWKESVHRNWDEIDHLSAFEDWKSTFDREYDNLDEERHHFLIFLDNWKMINNFNLAGKHNYTLGINQFSDMTNAQFLLYVHGHSKSCLTEVKYKYKSKTVKQIANKTTAIPDSIDWTNHNGKNYVTPIKNQGQCGSCWAFSATGCTESQSAIANNIYGDNIITLSEQELMDCSTSYGNSGCNGGLMDNAFKYIQANNGLCSEKDYPYAAKNGASCLKSQCSKCYSAISGYTDVYVDYEEGLAQAVALGPVSVAVEADQNAFQHYTSGVLDGECGTWIDHGMLVVGYGYDDTSKLKYWKVKNSWGDTWGMAGYILICKECGKNGSAGECGIASKPSYDHAKKV